jgi:hypothetical protein
MQKKSGSGESSAFSARADADAAEETIVSRFTEVEGVKLHYITAGHGTPLILLDVYAET